MAKISTVKKFAFRTKTLTNGDKIRWKFYYEDRKYDTYVNTEKYDAYKRGDISYEFPFNIVTGGFLYEGYEVLERYLRDK